jgi:hypothetical protein
MFRNCAASHDQKLCASRVRQAGSFDLRADAVAAEAMAATARPERDDVSRRDHPAENADIKYIGGKTKPDCVE